LAKPERFTITDKFGRASEYCSQELAEITAEAPALAKQAVVHTLDGFAQLVAEKLDGMDLADYFVQVDHYAQVSLNHRTTDQWGRRNALILAQPVKFDGFNFGQWINQEEFCIAVAAKFCDTDDKAYVLQMAGSLTTGTEAITSDDGFAQRAVIKQGVKPPEQITLKPKVSLAPFRTFPECQQVVSDFVFRCKPSPNGPLLMLVEADGGKWKIDAMRIVQRYVASLITETQIIA
jgi:hypothetical protein